MMRRTMYLIPGVATDRRVFGALNMANCDVRYLDWIPVGKGGSLQDYAARMAEQVDVNTQPILLGYSFGGLVSIEMSKLLNPSATVIVSSIKHYQERPLGMFITSMFGLNRFVPTRLGKRFPSIYKWMNDAQSAEEAKFIETMTRELSNRHTDWAIEQALGWRHDTPLDNLYHIHGTQDRIFPYRYVKNTIPVEGGSHLMLLNKAPQINQILNGILSRIEREESMLG